MIALCGRADDSFMTRVREVLRAVDIPAIKVGVELGFADVIARVPLVFFSASADAFAASLVRTVPREKILHISDGLSDGEIVDAVKHALFHRLGTDVERVHMDGVRFDGQRVFFRATELHLTKIERLIVRLLLHGEGAYFTAEEIAAACLADSVGGVSVHVSNVNAKAKRAHRIEHIADAPGNRAQQQQMDRINKVGNKLYAKQIFIAFALIGEEKQKRSANAHRLYENISERHTCSSDCNGLQPLYHTKQKKTEANAPVSHLLCFF